jgi:hypothetical protein
MTDETETRGTDIALEAAELEMALQLQDVAANGFSESVQNAVETAGYTFLFQMPAIGCEGSQCIAAISSGDGTGRRILLVHLHEDGETVRVEAPEGDDNPYAGIAASLAGVLEHLGERAPAA